ncbi:hypothetical protein [Streptomyces sp. NPDC016845]|uniref:hypothetical protein n=1 Tax=Streptomyces sp. NPDC016845 TaxID=3364972 RepID=UPI0037B7D147
MGRALAVVCATAALLASAACSSGEGDGDKAGTKGTEKTAARSPSSTQEPGPEPLTEARLAEAVITKADVRDHLVDTLPDEQFPDLSVPTEPAACQAIADLFLLHTEPAAAARVARSVSSLTHTDANVVRLGLLAHKEADAEKLMGDLRTSSEKCDGFEQATDEYSTVAPREAPAVGDEAVAYALSGKDESGPVEEAYVVVRSGSTLAVFHAMNAADVKGAQVPPEIIEAQLAKLEKAADPA